MRRTRLRPCWQEARLSRGSPHSLLLPEEVLPSSSPHTAQVQCYPPNTPTSQLLSPHFLARRLPTLATQLPVFLHLQVTPVHALTRAHSGTRCAPSGPPVWATPHRQLLPHISSHLVLPLGCWQPALLHPSTAYARTTLPPTQPVLHPCPTHPHHPCLHHTWPTT